MEIYKSKCFDCNGKGLIKQKELTRCYNCRNENNNTCYVCDRRGGAITYIMCNRCDGYGNIYYNAFTQKQVYLYSITNYKIVSNPYYN